MMSKRNDQVLTATVIHCYCHAPTTSNPSLYL